jgi:hypothetical protein
MPRLQSETVGAADQSWLGSTHGSRNARTETIDISTFTPSTHYPNGYIPSGTPGRDRRRTPRPLRRHDRHHHGRRHPRRSPPHRREGRRLDRLRRSALSTTAASSRPRSRTPANFAKPLGREERLDHPRVRLRRSRPWHSGPTSSTRPNSPATPEPPSRTTRPLAAPSPSSCRTATSPTPSSASSLGFRQGLVPIAKFRAYDAEPEVGKRRPGKRVTLELRPSGRRSRSSEYEQLRQRNATERPILNSILNTTGPGRPAPSPTRSSDSAASCSPPARRRSTRPTSAASSSPTTTSAARPATRSPPRRHGPTTVGQPAWRTSPGVVRRLRGRSNGEKPGCHPHVDPRAPRDGDRATSSRHSSSTAAPVRRHAAETSTRSSTGAGLPPIVTSTTAASMSTGRGDQGDPRRPPAVPARAGRDRRLGAARSSARPSIGSDPHVAPTPRTGHRRLGAARHRRGRLPEREAPDDRPGHLGRDRSMPVLANANLSFSADVL